MEMTKQKSNVIQDYEKVWENWTQKEDLVATIGHHQKTRGRFLETLGNAISNLHKGGRIIELGCGTAIDIGILSEKFVEYDFYATDLSKNAAKLAARVSRKFQNRFNVFVSDIKNLPFTDNALDLIFSQGVMEHFKDPMPVFLEQVRALKPGGFLIVNVPQKYTGYTLFKHSRIKKGTWDLGWEQEFSYKQLRAIGKDIDLTEIEVLGYSYWKSWKEPAFVLRDLMDKCCRFSPVGLRIILRLPQEAYNRMWECLEKKWGHFFMQNIVIVSKKMNNGK
ncbi:MAG: class I SAM-dependent methyltransferase [Deltaproteobacteria bacterium]|nr:class I SAM-dependent methyltransferase [Deltaproteobacteria bacterium]